MALSDCAEFIEERNFYEGPIRGGVWATSKYYAVAQIVPIAEAKAEKKAAIAARKAEAAERKAAKEALKLAKLQAEAGEIIGTPIDPTLGAAPISPSTQLTLEADRQAQLEADKLVEAKRKLDQAKAALGVNAGSDIDSPAAIRAFLDSLGVGKENAAPDMTA